ncbi:hypothetical protein FRC11_006417 [Ceratobasidium sp. 423]|nr:hypothetical protein FRC11_006417 [Ceratobasidium sp. 423]
MCNLPPELVRAIINYGADMARLALLNKHYNRISTPILYEVVVLVNPRSSLAFSRTLVTGRPVLREHVKSLEILHAPPNTPDNLPSLKLAIKELLMHAPKVTDLTLIIGRGLYQYLFEQPSFPFVLRRFCVESIPELESWLIRFLETQTQIESLRVVGTGMYDLKRYPTGAISPLESHLLPNLKEIEAMPTTIANLVPNRPVSRVYVDNSLCIWDGFGRAHSAFQRSSALLTHLSATLAPELGTDSWETEILCFFEEIEWSKESMVELVLKLVHWKLSFDYESLLALLKSSANPSHGFEKLRNQLSEFCSLKKFRLECDWFFRDEILPIEFCNTVPELSQFGLWKESCPLLEEVTIFGVSLRQP